MLEILEVILYYVKVTISLNTISVIYSTSVAYFNKNLNSVPENP
jgi:hypothetical protein